MSAEIRSIHTGAPLDADLCRTAHAPPVIARAAADPVPMHSTPLFDVHQRVVLHHTVTVCLERFSGPGTVIETAPSVVQRVRVMLDDFPGRPLWVLATELKTEPPL